MSESDAIPFGAATKAAGLVTTAQIPRKELKGTYLITYACSSRIGRIVELVSGQGGLRFMVCPRSIAR